jgi:hypothetical protein
MKEVTMAVGLTQNGIWLHQSKQKEHGPIEVDAAQRK